MNLLCKCMFVLLVIISQNIDAQLNQFMIQWYFSEGNCLEENCFKNANVPWRNDSLATDFFKTMKTKYYFNTVSFERQRAVDDFALKIDSVGLKTMIRCEALCSWKQYRTSPSSFKKSDAESALAKYSTKNYPNLMGYNIIDEPYEPDTSYKNPANTNTIEDITDYANLMREYNSSLLRWSNLLCGGTTYHPDQVYRENYVQKYINITKPNVLSFDDYAIAWGHITYFWSLYVFAMKSVENSIPFFCVITPFKDSLSYSETTKMSDYSYSAKSMAEFNYVIYAALAYGAKGIAYWPGFQWVRDSSDYPFALKFNNGELDSLAELHKKILSNSDLILSLNFASAYHVLETRTIECNKDDGEQMYDFNLWSNFANDKYAQQIFNFSSHPNPIVSYSGGSVPSTLAVTFLTNSSGQIYFWLFNKSLTDTLSLCVHGNDRLRYVVDVLNNVDYLFLGDAFRVNLAPGEGKLFTNPSAINRDTTSITNYTYSSGFYPFESGYQFNLGTNGSSGYSVVFNDSATKSFMADQITLRNVEISKGSTVRIKSYTDCNTITGTKSAVVKEEENVNTLQKEESGFSPSVYPNPTKNYFTLLVDLKENEKITVSIYDAMGRMIKTQETATPQTTISLSNQLSGLYLVHFIQAGKAYNYKILKQ